MTTIGNNIKRRREELGMTQEELANKLNYKSKSTINKIEAGINDITQSKVVAFAKVLDTTVAYLMGWEESEKNESALNAKDEREIGKDVDRILQEIEKKKNGSLYYNGAPLNEKHLELLKTALDIALDYVKNRNTELPVNEKTINNATPDSEESCTISPITLFTNVDDARKFLKSRPRLAAWKSGTLTDDDIINMANGIIKNEHRG